MNAFHVVFICHEATRSGAPILLLHLIRWLKDNTNLTFEVILQDGGPLLPDFEQLGPVILYRPSWVGRGLMSGRTWRRRAAKIYNELCKFRLRDRIRRSQASLFYFNTMAIGEIFSLVAPMNRANIVHIHELESVIQFLGKDSIAGFERAQPQYIAASRAVAINLANRHGVPFDRLKVIHEFISLPKVEDHDLTAGRANLCDQLGIPRDSILVGGMGTIERRKGTDLFVEVARSIQKKNTKLSIHFIWLGKWFRPEFEVEIRNLLRQDRVGTVVHFLGQVAQPSSIMCHFDLFALTSREDPYPLAMLEAGGLGIPVIGFADSGGAPEFIEEDAGEIVPFEDTEAMAEAILDLANNPERAKALGNSGAAKVRERHTLERTAPQVFDFIRQVAQSKR